MLKMLKSLHRRAVGIDNDDKLIAPYGFATGGDGKPSIVFPGPDTVAVFEDFLFRPTLGIGGSDTGLSPNSFTDTGTVGEYFRIRKNAATQTGALVAGTNGVGRIEMTISGATGLVSASSAMLVSPIRQWKANQGPGGQSGRLRFGCRLKASAWTHINSIFMGFTDKPYEIDTGTKEFPVFDTGNVANGYVANADDFVGFLFGNLADTGWTGIAGQATAVQRTALGDATTTAPVANVWRTYELEVIRSNSDTGGTAHFYIDGVKKGTISNPITSSAALNAIIAIADTGGSSIVDIDWVNISAQRDTGM